MSEKKRLNKNSSKAKIGEAKDALHRFLCTHMRHGYAYYRMIADEENQVDFVYEDVNESYEKLTGLNNVIGKRITETRPGLAKSTPIIFEKYARVAQTGIPDTFEIFIKNENHWYDVSLYSPKKGYVLSMLDDITERKLAENKLQKLSVAVEQSPAIVVITDTQGNIEYINPTFTKVTGYSAEEARGQNLRILKSGQMPQSVYEELWKKILSGDIWNGELHNKKKNGELYWEQGEISAIRNKENVITNFLGVKVDITEQKRTLQELIDAKQKALERDLIKAAHLASITHELRTPMTGILGFSELLNDPDVSQEESAEYIDIIHQNSLRLLTLINELIDIACIEAGDSKVELVDTCVNKLLQDIAAFFKLAINKKGLSLTCTQGLQDSESIINTDRAKLTQIFTNLISNALKFTFTGGIEIGYTRVNDMLEFYVKDSGIGIQHAMHEKIFDRFVQVNNPLTREIEGAGLGLSISKAYVAMLGGTIMVDSVEGKGSSFFFTIPNNHSLCRKRMGSR